VKDWNLFDATLTAKENRVEISDKEFSNLNSLGKAWVKYHG
jgi:hypothetical protein